MDKAQQTLLSYDARMLEHRPGPGHPERPERLASIVRLLEDRPVIGSRWQAALPAERAALARVHPEAHIDRVEAARGRRAFFDGDTAASERSVEAAWLAAGAAVQATEAVCRGEARNAFALVRPPGHHAEALRAMGFCLFNNVAVAAAHARAALGIERVLVVDWDVHHGNGTQHSFEERDDVLFFSSHRFPFYPGTGSLHECGRGQGLGFTVNVPMPAGMADGDFQQLFAELLVPVAEAYRPQLILVSAGFDAHRDDPLGDQRLSTEGFAGLCGTLVSLARRFADERLVLVLEGGYDLPALAASARACIQVLAGETAPEAGVAGPSGQKLLKSCLQMQSRYWKL